MIARTEVTRATNQGGLIAAKESGRMGQKENSLGWQVCFTKSHIVPDSNRLGFGNPRVFGSRNGPDGNRSDVDNGRVRWKRLAVGL
jgi:hypothetical protein